VRLRRPTWLVAGGLAAAVAVLGAAAAVAVLGAEVQRAPDDGAGRPRARPLVAGA
jgi:hypothetical protein